MKYHIFTPTTPAPANSLVVPTSGNITLLLVGGGGGGGSQHAGGGGAGTRYYRDAPLMIIGEGTNEIMKLLIARRLLEENAI